MEVVDVDGVVVDDDVDEEDEVDDVPAWVQVGSVRRADAKRRPESSYAAIIAEVAPSAIEDGTEIDHEPSAAASVRVQLPTDTRTSSPSRASRSSPHTMSVSPQLRPVGLKPAVNQTVREPV